MNEKIKGFSSGGIVESSYKKLEALGEHYATCVSAGESYMTQRDLINLCEYMGQTIPEKVLRLRSNVLYTYKNGEYWEVNL